MALNFFSMYKISTVICLSVFMLVLSSCSKDKYEFLEGTWEYVNVQNIDDAYTYEWNFENGTITMYRRIKNSNTRVVTDKGTYLLDTSPLKTTLMLIDTSQELINQRWSVIKLDRKQLIIKLDIVGGVLYKEFVKIN
jgi:hypothetical protein